MDLFRLLYLLGSEEKEPFHVFSSSPKREKSVSGEEIFIRNKRALIALAKEHDNNIENDDDDEKNVKSQSTCPLRSFLITTTTTTTRVLGDFNTKM